MAQATATWLAHATAHHDSRPDEVPSEGSKPVALAMTFNELLDSDNGTDESAEDIIRAVRAWRVE